MITSLYVSSDSYDKNFSSGNMTFYEYIILVLLSINFYSNKVLMAISYGPQLIIKFLNNLFRKL